MLFQRKIVQHLYIYTPSVDVIHGTVYRGIVNDDAFLARLFKIDPKEASDDPVKDCFMLTLKLIQYYLKVLPKGGLPF